MVKTIIAVFAGKLILFLTRMLKIGGGSAAPGLLALKIDSELVGKLISQIPQHVIITGTNGKTTTAGMLTHFLIEQGYRVINNATGSNLERGIASTLIQNFHPGGGPDRTPRDIGVWELDEFAFNEVAPKIKPQIVVFLNVFRDQLDRYGEVDTVVKRWCHSLKYLDKNTTILINGDDKKLLQLTNCFEGKVETFGVKDYKIKGESVVHQVKHSSRLNFEASNIKQNDLSSTSFDLKIDHKHSAIKLPLPGIYHVYDALAALVCAYYLKLPLDQITKHLKKYTPAFGRVERFRIDPNLQSGIGGSNPIRDWKRKKVIQGYIFLIKNPAGANQVFQTIAPQLKSTDSLLIALNDNFADGTDVSWIWDANFETLRLPSGQAFRLRHAIQKSSGLKSPKPRDLKIFVSGTRAQDLALRLKYAGFDPKYIFTESNLKKALKQATKGLEGRLFILPTYTALLQLQKILVSIGIKPHHYWKSN